MRNLLTRVQTHGGLLVILIIFSTLASIYSVVNPLFEAPDEVWHYEYVRWLVEGKGLPHPDDVGHAPWHQEGSQPPLYYLSAAALTYVIPTDNADKVIRYNPHAAIGQPDAFGNKNMMVHGAADAWPWRGVALAAHITRFFSVFLGALTVLAAHGMARAVFPTRPAVALLAAAIVAFNPQFLFLSAAVNNDNLITTISALTMWLAVALLAQNGVGATSILPGDRVNAHSETEFLTKTRSLAASVRCKNRLRAPTTKQLILLGLLVGLGALSKLSGLALAGVAGLTLMMLAWRQRSFSALVRWSTIVGVVTGAVAGWWYIRNWLLFGDPLALSAMFDILPRRPAPPTLDELLARAQGVWRSLWAVFGWFNVVVPDPVYTLYTLLSLLGLLGLILAWPVQRLLYQESSADRVQNLKSNIQYLQLFLLLTWIGVIFLSLLRWAQMRYPQGRLLYPALSAAAVLLAVGLLNWFPRRWQRGIALLIATVLFVPAAMAPRLWIAPVYAPPSDSTADLAPQQLIDAQFDAAIQLIGYELGRNEVRPGDALDVTLYWRANRALDTDYSVFIHLTDNYNILQVQRDSYPGQGNWPTSEWNPGDVIVDRHRIQIPATAPTPAQLRMDVGLYLYGTDVRLSVANSDTDFVTLGYVGLLPPLGDGSLPHSLLVNFDNQIALVGFDMDRRIMQPGETLTLTLWWEALSVPPIDYKVFTHLVLPPSDTNAIDATWAQMDSDPQRGAAPTSGWQVGERIKDIYTLTLPDHAPPGVYFVEVGLYDPDTNDRLQVNFSDKGVVLGQVRVTAQ